MDERQEHTSPAYDTPVNGTHSTDTNVYREIWYHMGELQAIAEEVGHKREVGMHFFGKCIQYARDRESLSHLIHETPIDTLNVREIKGQPTKFVAQSLVRIFSEEKPGNSMSPGQRAVMKRILGEI